MKLFGLTGKMYHGKDSFFAAVRDYQPAAVRVAFGDELKSEVATACGTTIEFINANKAQFRPVLQWWGTEFRRELHGNDYWLRKMEHRLWSLPRESVVFVTDCRFLNEAARW